MLFSTGNFMQPENALPPIVVTLFGISTDTNLVQPEKAQSPIDLTLFGIPGLGEIHYEIRPFNAFVKPAWYADGVAILKELSRLGIESEVFMEKRRILEFQRKKTTQKVNLYEKVQIPGYQEAIRKIKRYMEDEENLSKASSKIVKKRHAEEEEASAL